MVDQKVLTHITDRIQTYAENVNRSGEDWSYRDLARLAVEGYLELTDWKKDDTCRPMEGEPHFILLARDPEFAHLVQQWADQRARAIACGDRPASDGNKALEAMDLARNGAHWRRQNMGKWRK